ncbi:MAG: hypothetical protein JXR96_23305 [Deltaproteobacteria bacterium]|nr:hypothetical protein [Deltaproteobacteria bacterium]
MSRAWPSVPGGLLGPGLLVLLALLARPGLAGGRLSPEMRRCMARGLADRSLAIGERDAFALSDPHTGRILWLQNPRVLAGRLAEPGSIFKVVTAYAALQAGRVDPGRVFRCRGGRGPARPDGVRCWRRAGHGPVNLAKALAYSCNLYFADLGNRIGEGRLLAAARELGLGRATGSDLPGELAGRLPALTDGTAGKLAIGQGDIRVTPLQLLSLIGAVANGGALLSPRRAHPGDGPGGRRGVLEDAGALRFIRTALEEASTFGTGSGVRLARLGVAGKTGTAAWEKVSWRTHAWYMGYAPMRAPALALVVFVFDGQGSTDAAAAAREIVERGYAQWKACRAERDRR